MRRNRRSLRSNSIELATAERDTATNDGAAATDADDCTVMLGEVLTRCQEERSVWKMLKSIALFVFVVVIGVVCTFGWTEEKNKNQAAVQQETRWNQVSTYTVHVYAFNSDNEVMMVDTRALPLTALPESRNQQTGPR